MPWVDIIIVLIIAISGALGIVRGFVKEVVSLITWVAAIWLALTFSETVAAWLPRSLERVTFSLGGTDFEIRSIRISIAFIMVVIATLIMGAIVNRLLARVTQTRMFKGADRFLGLVFGVVRGAAIVMLAVLTAGLTKAPQTQWWREAVLIAPFEQEALWVIDLLPPSLAQHFSFAAKV